MKSLASHRGQHLIEKDELKQRIEASDSTLRVVDMRGSVKIRTEPDGTQYADYLGAYNEYLEGHIPGAVYLDWTQDIIDPDDPVPVQIASASRFAEVLSSKGIGDDHEVVAYDAHPACQLATRFWWDMRVYGHNNVRILNGGWNGWKEAGYPVSQEIPHWEPAQFTPQPQPQWRVTAEELQAMLGKSGITLLDARDGDQYHNRTRRGIRGGRIPGAIHLPRELMMERDGVFNADPVLADRFREIGVSEQNRCIAYCNGGVAATSVLFALSMLGYGNLANYDGSWNEWGERLDLPSEG